MESHVAISRLAEIVSNACDGDRADYGACSFAVDGESYCAEMYGFQCKALEGQFAAGGRCETPPDRS